VLVQLDEVAHLPCSELDQVAYIGREELDGTCRGEEAPGRGQRVASNGDVGLGEDRKERPVA
jgi:hypothetical protein